MCHGVVSSAVAHTHHGCGAKFLDRVFGPNAHADIVAHALLAQQAQHLAHRLAATGAVAPNRLVAVVMEKGWEQIVAAIDDLKKAVGKKKLTVDARHIDADFHTDAEAKMFGPLAEAMRIKDKLESYGTVDEVLEAFLARLPDDEAAAEARSAAKHIFHGLKEKVLREEVLTHGVRLDGRKFDEVRPIWTEAGVLPRVHGSVVFTRGETQALVTATLGTADDQQKIEMVDGELWKRFMLHYNFPPFSVGETGRLGGTKRREIGHGKLAWRAIRPLLPGKDKFPYTIRIVSEITESNGSSSMASVCGGSLSLMDAGVPMERPVAGIAMGLIKEGDRFAVLSDILGDEDHLGDMDFKVAGSEKGITALQMDLKITSINEEIMKVALAQAKDGRLHILGEMAKGLGGARESVSQNAPRITQFTIPKDKIREVIGTGGKVIREITETTGTKIDIEDDGTVRVASADQDKMNEAVRRIRDIVAEVISKLGGAAPRPAGEHARQRSTNGCGAGAGHRKPERLLRQLPGGARCVAACPCGGNTRACG